MKGRGPAGVQGTHKRAGREVKKQDREGGDWSEAGTSVDVRRWELEARLRRQARS